MHYLYLLTATRRELKGVAWSRNTSGEDVCAIPTKYTHVVKMYHSIGEEISRRFYNLKFICAVMQANMEKED